MNFTDVIFLLHPHWCQNLADQNIYESLKIVYNVAKNVTQPLRFLGAVIPNQMPVIQFN